MPALLLALIVWGDWDYVIIHDDPRVSQWSEHIWFLSLSSFQWDKQPRLIWKSLCFLSEPRKVTLQFEPSDFLYSTRVDLFPADIQGLPLWEIETVYCRSEWLTDCTQLLHYVLMLCLYAPVFALADKQSTGIHYSPPLCHGVDPLLLHTSPQMSGYIASHTVLRQQAHMSLSAGSSQGSQAGTPSPSTPPWGPEVTRRHSRAGSGWASCWVEWRWIMSRGKRLTKEQKLCPD